MGNNIITNIERSFFYNQTASLILGVIIFKILYYFGFNLRFAFFVEKKKFTPEIINLKLFNCSIETIQPRAFSQLNQLESLFLTRNKMKTIRADTFTGLINLRSLYLARNQIQTVERDAFTHMPDVEFIDFAYN